MNKAGHWNNYIEYLKDWATQHQEETNERMSPVCYEEFLDNEREDLNMAVVDAYDEYLQATEKRGVSYGELAYIEGLSDKQARDMLEECYQELNKIEENK